MKYLGSFLLSEGEMEREVDQCGLRSNTGCTSIYRSIYVPTLTYGRLLGGDHNVN